ncbi:MAG: MarR family transcriptional regulator [Flavobacteriales bacterium]|nr:MarR family transcriptional regulator [Flavobacteriales bacterium]
MSPEETIDFHIRWAWAKMSKAYNAEAAKHNATMPMAFALLSIDKNGTPATKLGPKMGMEPTSLTRLLKSLEDQGYIKREPDEADGRKVIVQITQKGKNYRDIAKQKVIQLNERMHEKIPQGKLNTFFEVIQTINTELDKNKIF